MLDIFISQWRLSVRWEAAREQRMLRLKIYGRFRAADDLGNELPVKSRKARALLAFLALPPGKPRSREELMALLWSERGDEQARGSLRQALSGLRRDLGDGPATALTFFDDAVSLDPEKIVVENASPGDELLEGLYINDPAFDEWLRDERLRLEEEVGAEPQREAPERSSKPSIAVLPFANMSGDPEQEYFADGITEDIITDLARFDSLFVISRNSSFHYKGQSPNIQKVGRELGVLYVVEGSVRRAGKRVRITAQLVEAETGNHLWAERYDRDLEDIFAVQDEVVSSIAMMVPGRIETAIRVDRKGKPTSDIGAYDLVLQADWLLGNDYSALEGIRLLEKAIEVDPNFAVAHAKLANHAAYGVFVRCLELDEARSLTRKHGETATSLAPGDAMVHGSLAEAYALVGEHALAAHHAEKALSLNPHAFYVMVFVAEAKSCLGEHDAACALIEKAMQNDPYSAIGFRENKVDAYYLAGRYQEAADQLVGWPNPPLHTQLAVAAALAQLGREAEASAEVRRIATEAPEGWDIVKVARAYHNMCARPEDGERWLEGFRRAGVDI
jgi:adenylate cyclase